MKTLACLAGLAVWAHAGAREAPLTFASAPGGTSLVELFSSEGCSSCPPADRWLGALRADPRLFKDFVPVAFHVNYWDYLGWKDALASPAHTARQRAHAASWGAGSVYTPGLVLDGREWRGWGRGVPLREGRGAPLSVTRTGDRTFRVAYGDKSKGLRAQAALLGFGLESRVSAGENEGRVLIHDFAALAEGSCRLDDGACDLVLPSGAASKRLALAAWIEREGSPAPLQAAGGWLP